MLGQQRAITFYFLYSPSLYNKGLVLKTEIDSPGGMMENSAQDRSQYYKTLGLKEGAAPDEIKKAYRQLSLQYHPDRAANNTDEANEIFIEITKAYRILLGIEKPEKSPVLPAQQGQYIKIKQGSWGNWRNRKKFGLWGGMALILFFIVISGSILGVRRNAMLKGLQQEPAMRTEKKVKPAQQSIQPQIGQQITSKEEPAEKKEKTPLSLKKEEKKEEVAVLAEKPQQQKKLNEEAAAPAPPLLRQRPLQSEKDRNPPLPQPLVVKKTVDNSSKPTPDKVTGTFTFFPEEKEAPVFIPHKIAKTSLVQKVQIIKQQAERHPSLQTDKKQLAKSIPDQPKKPAPQQQATTKNIIKDVRKKAKVARIKEISPKKEQIAREIRAKDFNRELATFLADYINAYEQRDLTAFISFFTETATENGTPVTATVNSYKSFFNSISLLRMKINVISWKREADNTIHVNGRYHLDATYTSSKIFSGAGQIFFTLRQENGKLLIQKLDYTLE